MKRRVADPADEGVDDQQVIQLHGKVERALDTLSGQPDPQVLEQGGVGQARGPKQLRFGEAEETKVCLIVDDARRVDVLPANVFFNLIAHK